MYEIKNGGLQHLLKIAVKKWWGTRGSLLKKINDNAKREGSIIQKHTKEESRGKMAILKREGGQTIRDLGRSEWPNVQEQRTELLVKRDF